MTFIIADDVVINLDHVEYINFYDCEGLQAALRTTSGQEFGVTGLDFIELAYLVRPSVLEGKRMKFAKHSWAFHNLVAHPLMQLLAFCHLYKWAMKVHDKTIPKAKL